MPRIRTIKPVFFKHEGLYDLEAATGLPLRVAYAGLWTVADKDGRFKWRPRELKTDVLPYDPVDFGKVLEALEQGGFIVRYEVDGKAYGYIPSWGRHQKPNHRETPSEIPDLPPSFPGMPGHARACPGNDEKGEICIQDENGTDVTSNNENFPGMPGHARGEGVGKGKGREGKGTVYGAVVTPPPETHTESDLPCHNPDLAPVAKRVVDRYKQAVRPGHPTRADVVTAVIGLLKGGLDESQLCQSVDNYAAWCDSGNRSGEHRLSTASSFFERHGPVEEFLSGIPPPPNGSRTERSKYEPMSERVKRLEAQKREQ